MFRHVKTRLAFNSFRNQEITHDVEKTSEKLIRFSENAK
jgi:hypothetical protein